MINLVSDIIDHKDMDALADWIKTYPRLTKGSLTNEFERKFADKIGRKHAVYVNSGSSANLLMASVFRHNNDAKGTRTFFRTHTVVVPAVAWSTSLSPFMELGYRIKLCDVNRDNLCINTEHLECILKSDRYIDAVLVVNVLGFVPNYEEIKRICSKYNVAILEDSCETLGSSDIYYHQAGTNGSMSSFSLYFGHHISTIEGGIVTTDSDEYYDKLLMARSHGWDRDLNEAKQRELRRNYNVDEFKAKFTFYMSGYNLRSTDLQAFIGLRQLDKLSGIHEARHRNFDMYQDLINNSYWKPNPAYNNKCSNFAYPVIHPRIKEISKALTEAEVEHRPLICGSLGKQPFIESFHVNHYNKWLSSTYLPNADMCDQYGLYVPNNPELSDSDIIHIAKTINGAIN